ncbi:MAG: hypothetical protein FJ404_03310 [Verrucomicrobia bacterium]|nr:hypothetical protein [Verrucomicrobiota bacterium]
MVGVMHEMRVATVSCLREEDSDSDLSPRNKSARGGLSWFRVFAWSWVLLLFLSFDDYAGVYPGAGGAQTFEYADGTGELSDGSSVTVERRDGGAAVLGKVVNRALWLSHRSVEHSAAAFRLPVLDPNGVMRSFELSCTIGMNRPDDQETGEGWSISLGKLPLDAGTGEGGFAPLPGGMTLAFDPFDEETGNSAIVVSVGGVLAAKFPRVFVYEMLFRPLSIRWDEFGLDVTYDGKVVCSDLVLPGFNPRLGDQFGFTARTTTRTMDLAIDNLRATTQVVPVVDRGGPIVSELAAVNSDFEDEFAKTPSWFELLNGSESSVDLTGWFVTDSRSNLTRWKIPSLVMSPYSYQVVFASGRNRSLATNRFLHASFELSPQGGFLALVRPDGQTIQSFMEYGPQDRGASFGEHANSRLRGHMFPPSPGAVNVSIPQEKGFAPEVQFSHAGVLLDSAVHLVLESSPVPGLVIRYTLDRTEPGPSSAIYSGPIALQRLTMVRARAYAPGYLPGRITGRTFVFLDETLTRYNGSERVFDSNLPLVFLESFGFGVDGSSGGSNPFRPVYAVVLSPDPVTGRASLRGPPDYAGPAGAHVRGESSSGFGQKSYALELRDEEGKDLDASLAGMPEESDWILYGPWSEKTLMRNKLVFDWMRSMRGQDGTAMRTRFVELFFHQSNPASGKVGYGSYRGIYVLMEKMKRGKDRVPLENLNSKTTDPELITGGYIFRKDKEDPVKTRWTTPRFNMPLQSFDPDQINPAQLNYLRGFLSSFETALMGSNFRDSTAGYRAYLDPDTFIDAQWMLEVAKQVDGYVFSTYFHKDRAGRLRSGPLWDFNISLGNADYATGDRFSGWLYDIAGGVGQNYYPRLHNDPEYRLAHWDRYWEWRREILSEERITSTIDGYMKTLLDGYEGAISNRAPANIQNPVARHFRRWPGLGVRDWPNPAAATTLRTWQAEVGYMRNWLRQRLEWLDDQSLRTLNTVLRPPQPSRRGGILDAPVEISISPFQRVAAGVQYPQGTIYYTLDGSDPRRPGGVVSPAATRYSSPILLDRSRVLKARTLVQNQWSPLLEEAYLVGPVPAKRGNVVISELMFQPAELSEEEKRAGLVEASQFEFLELMNVSVHTVDLKGVSLTKGVSFAFDHAAAGARFLGPGESRVLVADRRAFEMRNPHVPAGNILGQYAGRLDNGGETLIWRDARGEVIQEFQYNDTSLWPDEALAEGKSYVIKHPKAGDDWNNPGSWTASARSGGTPGVSGTGSPRFQGEPARDGDGDGATDLTEFLSGTDPENPHSRDSVQAVVVRVDGLPHLELRFVRQPGIQGVRMVWEHSFDLSTWSLAGAGLKLAATTPLPDGRVMDAFRASVDASPAPGARAGYWRLRFELE